MHCRVLSSILKSVSFILILNFRPPAAWERPFFFIVMADPQIGWNQDGYNSEELFGEAIDEANLLQPDFVAICGDLIDSSGSNDQFAIFKSIAHRLEMPYMTVPGNHDISEPPTTEYLDWYVQKTSFPLWHTYEFNNSLFIFLESNVLKNRDFLNENTGIPAIAREQMTWLADTLAVDSGNYNTIMTFAHHQLARSSVTEPDGDNLPQPVRGELLELYHQYDVTAHFAGHYHFNAYLKDGDLELITYTSTGVQVETLEGPGFGIVKVTADGMEQQFYRYIDLPSEVESDNPGFTLTFPDSGDTLEIDSIETVTWNSKSMASRVKLEYTMDDSNWTTISESTLNDGSFDWTIPDQNSATVKVRISSLLNSSIYDVSDGPNTIGAAVYVSDIIPTLSLSNDLKFHNSRIYFQIHENSKSGKVQIRLYNLQGKLLKTLVNGKVTSGYSVFIPRLSKGLYLCKMEAEGFNKTISIIVTK